MKRVDRRNFLKGAGTAAAAVAAPVGADSVPVIDAASNTVVATLMVWRNPFGIAISQ